MAAGPITVARRLATIECTDSKNVITIAGPGKSSLTNLGPSNVFIRDLPDASANLARDGAQRNGEIELEVGDSVPLPDGATKIEHQCIAAQTSKMWYVPLRS